MVRSYAALAAVVLAIGAYADQVYIGFNSDPTIANGSATTPKLQADWEMEFNVSKNLDGFSGQFNAVKLSTNIQPSTKSDPISAFPAAISTKTFLLLGIWASDVDSIDLEISALKKGLDQHGQDLASLIIGIAIGSEDLYRSSDIGVKNGAGKGNSPANITKFINQFRQSFNGTLLASVPVGHVDTWNAWGNVTNTPVLDAVDWVGVNAFPYYENGKCNTIKNAPALFDNDYNAALASAKGKPLWITGTGWPQAGSAWDQAVPSVDNAADYWANVGCRKLFGQVPTFWMSLRDTGSLNFGITSRNFSSSPSFNLTCPTTFTTPGNLTCTNSTSTTSTTKATSTPLPSSTSSSVISNPTTTTSNTPTPRPSGSAGSHTFFMAVPLQCAILLGVAGILI